MNDQIDKLGMYIYKSFSQIERPFYVLFDKPAMMIFRSAGYIFLLWGLFGVNEKFIRIGVMCLVVFGLNACAVMLQMIYALMDKKQ